MTKTKIRKLVSHISQHTYTLGGTGNHWRLWADNENVLDAVFQAFRGKVHAEATLIGDGSWLIQPVHGEVQSFDACDVASPIHY